MGLLDDYSAQARAYDRTRGVSEPVIGALRSTLEAAPGPHLADVGGGTGNYAAALRDHGFDPVVFDRSVSMLAVAETKGLQVVESDAADLPAGEGSFDAVLMVSMLHHVDDRPRAVREAVRVLAPAGILVLIAFTREDARRLWVLDLFPSSRPWMEATHPPRRELLALLSGAEHAELVLDDMADASMAALCSRPDLMLDPAWRSQTSYFERMERDHPGELAAGLAQLEREVANGRAQSEAGRATLISWRKPPTT